jgi:pimeloyl-ACP methyl ester carboxylesterase
MLVMPQESGGLFEIIGAGLPEDDKAEFKEFMTDYFNFGAIFSKTDDDLVAANDKLAGYYSRFAEQSLNPTQPEASTAQAWPGGWMVFGMYFSMGQAHDYRDALKAIIAPTLVLRDDGDFQSADVKKMYVDAIPNARMKVIQGVTHFMYEEKPEEFTETVGRFLDSL